VPPSDRTLLERCRAGDRGAWQSLVERYQRLLYGTARRCGLAEEDAADLFQTVWLRLLENLDTIQDEQHLTGWLILTARREAWRVVRRRGRETSLPTANPETGGEADLEDPLALLPEAELVRLEEQQLVRAGLAELGERCRNLLGWLYQTDPPVPYAEIARRLDVSIGAIGPTRARCLQQLRRILERRGF